MGFLLTQAGNTLYKINPSTGATTALTLPTGVTLSTTRKPKFAILDQWVAMVNSPTRNLVIDPEGTVRVMVPMPPTNAPIGASGGAGNLTGDIRLACSFVVNGSDGQLYMESPISPLGVAVTLASNSLAGTSVPISQDTISTRRIYRTLAGGTVLYRVLDVDGNTGTTFFHNTADAGVELLPVSSADLVAPPGTIQSATMKNIVSWKSRLWGVSSSPDKVDEIVFTEARKVYAWPNSLVAYPTGQDTEGVVAFGRRRDELGVLKRDGLWQISGDSADEFGIVSVQYGRFCGCVAPDTVVEINDRVYWLSNTGVWEWGPDGLQNISEDSVDPWFMSDTYFTRSRFPNAFARYNEHAGQYDLHLAALGSVVEDRWVSYNVMNRKWYGPHKTGALTPSHAASGVDLNNLPLSLVGGTDGKVYLANQATFHDGTTTAIDFDVMGTFHFGNGPDIEHYFGELSMLSKVEAAGTLTVTPKIGRLNVAAGSAISHTLTTGRERLRRLGTGAGCQLRFQQATVDVGASIFGYEIPWHELGRR